MVLTEFSPGGAGTRDLSEWQRWGLSGLVVGVHVVVGLAILHAATEVAVPVEQAPIIVNLLNEPRTEPVPERPPVTEPPPKPLPPRSKPVPPASVREAPKVAASTRTARPEDMQVPVAAPVPQPAPVLAPQPAPPQPAVAEAAPPAKSVAPPSEPAPPAPSTPRVVKSSSVCYLVRPVPVYPIASQELGEEGTVIVKVLIDQQGKAKEVSVDKSSGYPRLDRAAVAAEKTARYRPYMEGGVVHMALVTHPTTFTLNESNSNERNQSPSSQDCR